MATVTIEEQRPSLGDEITGIVMARHLDALARLEQLRMRSQSVHCMNPIRGQNRATVAGLMGKHVMKGGGHDSRSATGTVAQIVQVCIGYLVRAGEHAYKDICTR